MNDPISPGKQVLLRALDHITEIEEDTGGTVQYLAVVYAVTSSNDDGDSVTTRGWDATDHPHFVITGLLREVAARMEGNAVDPDTDEDDDGED